MSVQDKQVVKVNRKLDEILDQIEEFTRTLLELRRVGQRLATIAEEEEDYDADVDSDADTVVLENLPPPVPLKRETAVACE